MTPQELFEKYSKEIAAQGIELNPDQDFTFDLLAGILKNRERYGADYCPCRLVTGNKDIDREIICPCVYRDDDIEDFGQCFCALYVNQEWITSGQQKQIPDRWPSDRTEINQESATMKQTEQTNPVASAKESQPQVTLKAVTCWQCSVCGYLCLRPQAPPVCPVCGVKKDRFNRINLAVMT